MSHIARKGPQDARVRLIIAHGAGAGIDTPFMTTISDLIAARGIGLTLFEFEYMAARRSGGSRRPPPRAERLTGEYEAIVKCVAAAKRDGQVVVIGGKSLGGRVASLIADSHFKDGAVSGLVCLGYPFHPPGKPDRLRTAHLAALACPALIVQGERDPFGSRAEVASYKLAKAVRVHWLDDGDHDFGPRGASGFTRSGNLAAAADAVAAFASALKPASD